MNIAYATARRNMDILALVPAERQNKVSNALANYGGVLNNIVQQMFGTYDRAVFKPHTNQISEYIQPINEISLYGRYGAKQYGRFGHNYICVANIGFPSYMQRQGMFSALIFWLMYECKKREIVLAVENPLEGWFREYLLKIGFVKGEHAQNSFDGTGTYYFLPQNLISDYEFHNIEAYRNER